MNEIQRMEGESDEDFNARVASLQDLGTETPQTTETLTSGAETVVLNSTAPPLETITQVDSKPEEEKLPGSRDVTFTEYKELVVELEARVFPSELRTIVTMVPPGDAYGGAHRYCITNCLGFSNGQTNYQFDIHPDTKEVTPRGQMIQFIEKNDDGSMTPGLQSEQLVFVLLDRHKKLNARFPSAQSEKMIKGLEMFIEACEERVKERIERGVMGELKK